MSSGGNDGVLARLNELRVMIGRLQAAATSPRGQRRLREATALLHDVEDAIVGGLRDEAVFVGGSGPVVDATRAPLPRPPSA